MLQWKFCRTDTTTKDCDCKPISMEISPIDKFQLKTRGNYENLSTQWRSKDFCFSTWDNQLIIRTLFVYLIAGKLPTETRKSWELSSKGKELEIFLEESVQALESAAPSNSSSNTRKQSHSQQNQTQRQLHTHVTTRNQQCKCCEEKHRNFKCGKFIGLGVKERAQLIKIKGLCFNCLLLGHRAENSEGSSCHQCGRKHHALLHRQEAHNVNNLVKKNRSETAARLTQGNWKSLHLEFQAGMQKK